MKQARTITKANRVKIFPSRDISGKNRSLRWLQREDPGNELELELELQQLELELELQQLELELELENYF